jgi:hypothetical protein
MVAGNDRVRVHDCKGLETGGRGGKTEVRDCEMTLLDAKPTRSMIRTTRDPEYQKRMRAIRRVDRILAFIVVAGVLSVVGFLLMVLFGLEGMR